MFERLFDSRVRVVAGPISDLGSASLTQAEVVAIAGAGEKRRREFATGRLLARQVLAEFGQDCCEVPAGHDRAPIWPEGFVGSISHTDSLCAVAVAQSSSGIAGIGLDIEEARPLPSELRDEIMDHQERERLPFVDVNGVDLAAMILFSAKEAAYKCQYRLSEQFLEFSDLSVSVRLEDNTFAARFNRSVGPFAIDDCLEGRWQIVDGHIATAAVKDAADVGSNTDGMKSARKMR